MAKYRQVQTSFWKDGFTIELTPEEKFFFLYLMTNDQTTQCGIYELPKRIIEMDTGYNRETVEKLLKRFDEYGKIKYNEENKEIFIINWAKHNWINSPKVIKCIESELKKVKTKTFIHQYLERLKGYGYGIDTLSIDYGEEEEEEKEKKNVSSRSQMSDYSPEFENFWNEYPRKTDKKAAFTKWKQMIKRHDIQDIIKGAKGYALEIAKTRTEQKYIKHAKTFLHNEVYLEYKDKSPEERFIPEMKPIGEETIEERDQWGWENTKDKSTPSESGSGLL
jgi:hypothetical protein